MSARLTDLDLECLARALWETYGEAVGDGAGWDQLSGPQRSLWRSSARVALNTVVLEIVNRNLATAEETIANLRLISNVNGDWNLKFMELEERLREANSELFHLCVRVRGLINEPGIQHLLPPNWKSRVVDAVLDGASLSEHPAGKGLPQW